MAACVAVLRCGTSLAQPAGDTYASCAVPVWTSELRDSVTLVVEALSALSGASPGPSSSASNCHGCCQRCFRLQRPNLGRDHAEFGKTITCSAAHGIQEAGSPSTTVCRMSDTYGGRLCDDIH